MTELRATGHRWARPAELAVAVASVGVALTAAWLVRPSDVAAGIILVAAIAAGAAPFVIVAFAAGGEPAAPEPIDGVDDGTRVTTVVRVGGEPLELVLACVALTSRAGPTFVVTAARPDLDAALAALGVPLVRDETIEAALRRAAGSVATDAVLVIQPGAVPVMPACARAASRLTDRTGWVVGAVRSFDDDSYAPETREVLGARLRARAWTGGLDLWERDATIVRTQLLRDHAIPPRRPWGAWLRSLRAHGTSGARDDAVLALRTVPAGAPVFWPATVSRQRATAADLSDAMTSGSARSRVLGAGLLLRELYAYPLMVWLLAPLIVSASGAFPFRWPPIPILALVLGAAVARWLVLRLEHGIALQPLRDLLAVAYDAPGSARALFAASSRRLAPTRVRVSQRTLVWAALLLALAAVVPLLDQQKRETDLEVTAGLAVVVLVLLWLFVLRLIAARHWTRAVTRVALHLDVQVDGCAGHSVDLSPAGLAVEVDAATRVPAVGTATVVTVAFPDGPFAATAVVADRRMVAGREILGLSLSLDPERRAEWVRRAFDLLRLDEPGAELPHARSAATAEYEARPRAGPIIRMVDSLAIVLVGVIAVLVAGALALAVAGYRPLVVRSGSMVPTLAIGDLIVVDDVRARDVHVGDIVAYVDATGESVTHRVRSIAREDGRLEFETRGDANDTSEHWSRRPDAVLGRYAWRIPVVGRYLSWLHGRNARWALLGVAIAFVLAGFARSVLVSGSGRAGADAGAATPPR
ncbi:MAG: signal peptidase I [Acidimicrobiia bacterium]